MMKKYVHIVIGSMAVAFLLWLTVADVEQRWADSHVVLGWGTLVMLALAIILHLPGGGKLLRWSWTDMLVAVWMIYVVGRVWMGNEYVCGTEFLKMMEMGLLYVAFKGILSWTQLSPTYIIYGILLCGVYETGLGVWQLVSGTSRHSLYLMTGSFQNPGPYSAYLMMAVVLSMTLSRHGNGEIVSEHSDEGHGHEVRISLKKILPVLQTWLPRVTLLMAILILPATWSRAALVSVGIVALWLYRQKYWKYRWAVWIGIVVLAAGFYLAKQGSADGRMLTWTASLTAWWHQPWLGVGVGGFRVACADGIAELYREHPASGLFASGGVTDFAFNDLLKVLVEQGLVGAVLCIVTAAWVMISLYKQSIPLFYALLSLFIFSMFSYPFELLPYQILLVLLAAYAQSKGSDKKEEIVRCNPWRVVFLFVLLPVAYFLIREIQHRHETDQEVSMFSGMHHEAFINDYYELMPLEMDNVSFLFDFGKTLREAKRYNDSNAVFRQGTQVSSDPMFWVLIGNNYRDMQCYQEAEEAYQKAFAIMPNRLYPLYQLMGLYEETGDVEALRRTAREIMALQPKIKSPATEAMADSARRKVIELEK